MAPLKEQEPGPAPELVASPFVSALPAGNDAVRGDSGCAARVSVFASSSQGLAEAGYLWLVGGVFPLCRGRIVQRVPTRGNSAIGLLNDAFRRGEVNPVHQTRWRLVRGASQIVTVQRREPRTQSKGHHPR